MSTLPETAPEIKRKTIAEIAKEKTAPASNPNPQPQKQKHHETRGAAMNKQFEAEYEKFIGKPIELVARGEIISGTCIAASPYGHVAIQTATHKVIVKNWDLIRRPKPAQKEPVA